MKNFIEVFQSQLKSHAYHNDLTPNQVMSAFFMSIDEVAKNGTFHVMNEHESAIFANAMYGHEEMAAFDAMCREQQADQAHRDAEMQAEYDKYEQRYSDEQVEEELAWLEAANTVDTDHLKASPSTIEAVAAGYQIQHRTKQVYSCVIDWEVYEIDITGGTISSMKTGKIVHFDTVGKEAFKALAKPDQLAYLVAIILVNRNNI